MRPEAAASQTVDKLAIREVLDEYCLRLEVDSLEDWLDLFTEDTVYEVFGKTLRGRQEVASVLSRAPHGVHMGGACRVILREDRAQTLQNYVFFADDEKLSNTGWYYRTLIRTDAGWRISHTRVEIHKRSLFGPMLRPA